jgi:hypothetical protein
MCPKEGVLWVLIAREQLESLLILLVFGQKVNLKSFK